MGRDASHHRCLVIPRWGAPWRAIARPWRGLDIAVGDQTRGGVTGVLDIRARAALSGDADDARSGRAAPIGIRAVRHRHGAALVAVGGPPAVRGRHAEYPYRPARRRAPAAQRLAEHRAGARRVAEP